MRRMRNTTIKKYVLVAIPVLGALVGVPYLIRHHQASLPVSLVNSTREPASAKNHSKKPKALEEAETAELTLEAMDEETDEADEEQVAVSTGKTCERFEYRGAGPDDTQVTKAEWNVVMSQFHTAKKKMLHWLEEHHTGLPEATVVGMEKRVNELKIQRPPVLEEPDLAWRGIGVYASGGESGEPIIRVGGGFVKLALAYPDRAKFELARLVAQAWAPCELKRISPVAAWKPLLDCMNMKDAQTCGEGTFSEEGWAVSTTLANAVMAPGCELPVLKNPELAKCMKLIPFGGVAVANLEGKTR